MSHDRLAISAQRFRFPAPSNPDTRFPPAPSIRSNARTMVYFWKREKERKQQKKREAMEKEKQRELLMQRDAMGMPAV